MGTSGQKLELAAEYPPPDEQIHIDSLIEQLRNKMGRDYAASRTLRDAHPKMHGCVRAEFLIEANLPPELGIGVFKAPRTFPAWIRFSNQSNTVAPDWDKDIRGVAIKLMGVDGEKLLEHETQEKTQDFILISDNRFVTKDVAQFDGLVKGLTSGFLSLIWFFLTHLRVARNLIFSLRRHANPLEIQYFSVAPYRLGAKAVKYTLRPSGAVKSPLPEKPSNDYLREAMVRQLTSGTATFDFMVQFQSDPDTMPIEDPGIAWDEAVSPFRKVATLTIGRQDFDSEKQREFGDNLSFNPWRCLSEHRPLGGINRARRQVYAALSTFRHQRNAVVKREPTPDEMP